MDFSKLSDEELVVKMRGEKAESDAAFAELYDRHSSGVYAYCRRILNSREQAEDAFQETFVRFYEKAKKNHKGGSTKGFLITIARNLCLNLKRDKKSSVQIEEFEFLAPTGQTYEEDEMAQLLRTAIELLDAKYREPLVLKTYNGLSCDEIAEIIEETPVNVRTLIHRAKKQIKKILKPYLEDIKKHQK